jgi:hypothetical protein
VGLVSGETFREESVKRERRNHFYMRDSSFLTSQTQQERDKQAGKNKGTGFLAVPAAVI